jgi:hypothetical protein
VKVLTRRLRQMSCKFSKSFGRPLGFLMCLIEARVSNIKEHGIPMPTPIPAGAAFEDLPLHRLVLVRIQVRQLNKASQIDH